MKDEVGLFAVIALITLGFVIVVLLLSGCAASETSWRNPAYREGFEQEMAERRAGDYAYCRSYGASSWGGAGGFALVAWWAASARNADVYDACMRAKGWTR